MVAIVPDPELSLGALYDYISDQLEPYARPLFVRVRTALETTGTFKHRKVDLVTQGFDPAVVSEPLYFRDDQQRRFVAVDKALYERIIGGRVRL